ncbi:hypothetical protein [Legionella worsleiensis]|uniref:Uncharacterized protein n=1 Tax=Legionella worsleiensis TaxID=45076 RepID=A0A0W1A418_9GAMM|nr:hypothetical protein [Legionella worsleiensis]KTD75977.1 hypothetical protein Lwor_2543 [Legionella worsleiensis]STY32990.1 Uncharacterised protein [Legionella worsleiensis]
MNDFKSKLPDLKELSSMGSKLFKGIKSSVEEIIQDYKQKREHQETPVDEVKTSETSIKSTETAGKSADEPTDNKP